MKIYFSKNLTWIIPLLTSVFLSIFVSIFWGNFLESYEKIFSSFIHGTYTDYATNDYDIDVQFFLFSLYSYINKFIPNIQVYIVILILQSIISLSIFAYACLTALKKSLNGFKLYLVFFTFVFTASLLLIINLSSTRIVVLSVFSTFYIVSQKEFEFKKKEIVLYLIFLFIISLIRIDAVVLCSLFFLILIFLIGKIKIVHFLPIIISLTVFSIYNINLIYSNREAKKVFYYKELELIDRKNIDYNKLKNREIYEINLITEYNIFDEKHFKIDYINSILKTNQVPFFNSLFNIELYINTFKESIPNLIKSFPLIAFSFLLIVYIFYNENKQRVKTLFLMVLFLFLPLIACFYIALPLRFLEPYYFLFITFLLISKGSPKVITLSSILFAILITIKSNTSTKIFNDEERIYKSNYNLLYNMSKNDVVVIDNVILDNFFPITPMKISRLNSVIMNFSFFNSFEAYQSKWTSLCNCNPLSLMEKLLFISDNEIPFITSIKMTSVYSEYFKKYRNAEISFTKIQNFNEELDVFKIQIVENKK